MAKHKQQTDGGTTATVEAGQAPPVPQGGNGAAQAAPADNEMRPHDGNPNVVLGAEKPKESKRSRFIRLASRRVSKALKALSVIENLGNRSQYDYTEEHAQRIMGALGKAVDRVYVAFNGDNAKDNGFTL